MKRGTITPVILTKGPRVLCILQQSAWTKIRIIVKNQTGLKIIFWIRASDFDQLCCIGGLFLQLKNFIELPTTIIRGKNGSRNDKAFKVVLFFVFLCFDFGR